MKRQRVDLNFTKEIQELQEKRVVLSEACETGVMIEEIINNAVADFKVLMSQGAASDSDFKKFKDLVEMHEKMEKLAIKKAEQQQEVDFEEVQRIIAQFEELKRLEEASDKD